MSELIDKVIKRADEMSGIDEAEAMQDVMEREEELEALRVFATRVKEAQTMEEVQEEIRQLEEDVAKEY